MRTLFLLTILAALLVIVIKKPDQTFWEAAHGLWGKIEGIASEVTEAPPVPRLTGNAREDSAALRQWVRRRMLGIDKGSGDAVDGEPPVAGSKGGTERDGPANTVPYSPMVSPKAKPEPAVIRNAEIPASSSGDVKVLPRSRVTDLPYIPAVPVAPVEVMEIGKGATPPSRSRPRSADSRSLGEVKAHYENASRLLAEIK